MKESKDNFIHIGPDYAIQGDTYCVTIFKRRIVQKTGKVQWDAIAYCSNLEQAYHRLIDMDLGPINNFQDIAERILDLKKWISDATQSMASDSIAFRSDAL